MIGGLRNRLARRAPADEVKSERTVSVVMPVYNHAGFVGDAIESVLADRSHLRELIVVDDGSTDHSLDVVRQIAAHDDRLVYWTQPNRGAHAALNAGMARASGRYVAILNSDDVFAPGRLAALCTLMESDPALWMAASNVAFIDGQGRETKNAWHDDAVAFASSCPDFATSLINANLLISTSNFLIRRDLLERIGPFAPLRYAHDLDFAIRVVIAGGRIAVSDARLLSYRMHDSNTISEDHRRVRREWAMVAGVYLASHGRPTANATHWPRLASLLPVLERHDILRGATFCAAYLHGANAATIAQSGMLADEGFLQNLSTMV